MVELAPNVLEQLVVEVLAADERFVRTGGGTWELRVMRDCRHEAAMRSTVEPGEESVPVAERYVVPQVNR